MANYEYIIASLPDITTGWKFGEKGPQDYIEEIVSLCSDKDRELIDFLMNGYMDEIYTLIILMKKRIFLKIKSILIILCFLLRLK